MSSFGPTSILLASELLVFVVSDAWLELKAEGLLKAEALKGEGEPKLKGVVDVLPSENGDDDLGASCVGKSLDVTSEFAFDSFGSASTEASALPKENVVEELDVAGLANAPKPMVEAGADTVDVDVVVGVEVDDDDDAGTPNPEKAEGLLVVPNVPNREGCPKGEGVFDVPKAGAVLVLPKEGEG